MARYAWSRLVLLVVAAGLLISGTGTFDSVAADRSVTVDVLGDDEAPLGVRMTDRSLSNGVHEVTLARVTNRFDERLGTVRVTITGVDDGHPRVLATQTPGALRSGESASIRARIVCRPDVAPETMQVRVVVRGESVSVALDRQVTVSCTGAAPANNGTDQ